MPRLKAALAVLIAGSIFFPSCQKEPADLADPNDPAEQASLEGNYKFVSIQAHTVSIVEASDGTDTERMVTLSNYTSQNNAGTVTIGPSSMSSSNLSYSINSKMKGYMYLNGVLLDSVELPFQFTAPASSATAPFQKIGRDSLYFSSGTMFMSGATQATAPGGAKLRWEGDKLLMTSRVNESGTETDQGVTTRTTNEVNAVITLQKQ